MYGLLAVLKHNTDLLEEKKRAVIVCRHMKTFHWIGSTGPDGKIGVFVTTSHTVERGTMQLKELSYGYLHFRPPSTLEQISPLGIIESLNSPINEPNLSHLLSWQEHTDHELNETLMEKKDGFISGDVTTKPFVTPIKFVFPFGRLYFEIHWMMLSRRPSILRFLLLFSAKDAKKLPWKYCFHYFYPAVTNWSLSQHNNPHLCHHTPDEKQNLASSWRCLHCNHSCKAPLNICIIISGYKVGKNLVCIDVDCQSVLLVLCFLKSSLTHTLSYNRLRLRDCQTNDFCTIIKKKCEGLKEKIIFLCPSNHLFDLRVKLEPAQTSTNHTNWKVERFYH